MKPLRTEDAYGHILLAAFEGRAGHEIMERDDGLIYCGDPSDYFAPFPRWPRVERRAVRFARGRVLDVGCGAGRVSLYLQSRGLEVSAIDTSPIAIDIARKRGVRSARVCSIADAEGEFDTIVLVRNNFGLAGDPRRAMRLLKRLHRATSEAGRIITDSVDPRRVDPELRRYAGRSKEPRFRVRFQRLRTPWFRYWMSAPERFAGLVDGTGWRIARIIDDGSPRYAVILEKA
jgi:SAM-dependent methyltransferase